MPFCLHNFFYVKAKRVHILNIIFSCVAKRITPGQLTPGIMNRVFSLDDGYLEMDSYLDDEFGEVVLWTRAALASPSLEQSSSQFVSVDVRINEMKHFLRILKLFDPKVNYHGLSEIVSPETEPERT